MQHRVTRDRVGKVVQLGLAGQIIVEQEVGGFHEAGALGQLSDWIAAMEQDAFFAIDKGQRALAARGRLVAGIEGEFAGRAIELADIDHIRSATALKHGEIHAVAADFEFGLGVGHGCLLGC